jgi:hypothetical protein
VNRLCCADQKIRKTRKKSPSERINLFTVLIKAANLAAQQERGQAPMLPQGYGSMPAATVVFMIVFAASELWPGGAV